MSNSKNIDDLDTSRLINCPQVLNTAEKSAESNSTYISHTNLNKNANNQHNPNDVENSFETLKDNGNANIVEENEQKTYEKQEKTTDMAKLKDAIWKSMALSGTDDNNILKKEEELHNEKHNKVRFSNVYKALPSQMAKELRTPLAFVALLHLATEENLKLEGTPELNDIFISTDKK